MKRVAHHSIKIISRHPRDKKIIRDIIALFAKVSKLQCYPQTTKVSPSMRESETASVSPAGSADVT